jgi:periplasmic divalent cation tolerance protein
MSDAVIVLTTAPSTEVGEQLGRALVVARLAACVNVLPAMVSVYRWQGDVQREVECQVVIKTSRSRADDVRAWIREHHPYELPECLVVAVDGGDPEYLAWVSTECAAADG